jgi:hypothetical protein
MYKYVWFVTIDIIVTVTASTPVNNGFNDIWAILLRNIILFCTVLMSLLVYVKFSTFVRQYQIC